MGIESSVGEEVVGSTVTAGGTTTMGLPAGEEVASSTDRLGVVGFLFGGGQRPQPPHGATYPPRAMSGV
jgi:hypothetical protein